jgi:hypothetical protein
MHQLLTDEQEQQQFLPAKNMGVAPHSSCMPDFASCEFFLFKRLKSWP